MKFFDNKFKGNAARYVAQCGLAAVAVLIILAFSRSISNAAIIASLGATTFILFALPHAERSQLRYSLGGYAVGVVVGSLCYWLARLLPLPEQVGVVQDFPHVVFGALAVGLAMLVMVVTNTEHPPAAGVALGFALLAQWHWATPGVVLAGICALCLVQHLLKPVLRNLL